MIITIASFKGGVGKSTIAYNLALYLATRRKAGRVVLSDGDPNETCLDIASRAESLPFEVLPGAEDVGEFDSLVVDTPARTEGDELLQLASGSDWLLIPTTIDVVALSATLKTLATLPTASNMAILLSIVPTRAHRREAEAREALSEVTVLKRKFSQRIIHQDLALSGVPLNKSTAAKVAWAEMQAIGREVVKGWC